MEEEKAEHERKLGDRGKMGDFMLNNSQSKNGQEVEGRKKGAPTRECKEREEGGGYPLSPLAS